MQIITDTRTSRQSHSRRKLDATTHEITCSYFSTLLDERIVETQTVTTYAKSRPQRCPTCGDRI